MLAYLHGRTPPIIFRDLKPANIMWDGERVVLIDFGIARLFKPGQSTDTTALGSHGFAAPEQYGRAQTTPRSDLYSLGVTLHTLLTGDDPSLHPFRFTFEPLTHYDIEPAGHPAIGEFDALIQGLVARESTNRPQQAREAQKALEQIARSLANPLPPPAMVPPVLLPTASSGHQVCLLAAPEDDAFAQELTGLLQMADPSLVLLRNDDSLAGFNRRTIWNTRLQTSRLFVLLVSARLRNSEETGRLVQEVISTTHADQIVAVYLRPSILQNGTFEGIPVVPDKAVSTLTGGAREQGWVDIVSHILAHLAPQAPLPMAAFVLPQASPTSRVASSADAWRVSVLLAERDRKWIEPLDQVFRIMRRTIPAKPTVVVEAETLDDGVLQRVEASMMTRALFSPDFLASDWLDCYEDINTVLEAGNRWIIPIVVRPCSWQEHLNVVALPRDGSAIGSTGNDEAWTAISRELRGSLLKWFPERFQH